MPGTKMRDNAGEFEQRRHGALEHASLIGIAVGLAVAGLLTWGGVRWMNHKAYFEINGCLADERKQRQLGLPAPEFSCFHMLGELAPDGWR